MFKFNRTFNLLINVATLFCNDLCLFQRPLPCRIAAVKTLLVIVTDPSQEKHKLRMKNKILGMFVHPLIHIVLSLIHI